MLVKTKEPHFFNYIRWRIKKQKNFLCATVGGTGSGKSYSNLRAIEILNPDKKPKELIQNMCLTGLSLMDRLNSGELQKGDGIVLDEVGISLSAKEWQSVSNKLINQVLQTFRHLNLIVFFNTPSFNFIDASSRRLFHSIWQTMNINFKTNRCEIKPMLLQTNPTTGKVYFKYLRVDTKEYGLLPVTRLYLDLPSAELLKLYNEKKAKFTKELNERVYKELQQLENKSQNKKPLTEYQQQIYDMIKEGKKIKEIAKIFGVTDKAITGSLGLIRKKVVVPTLFTGNRRKTFK